MEPSAKIFVAGHAGLVGSGLVRRLQAAGFENLITRRRAQLDLLDPVAVRAFFETERPSHVFLAAAKVGGILANSRFPVDFLQENLLIQCHVIAEAYRSGVQKLLFLGSSCIYPKLAPQPIKEEYLLTGPLEPTNDAYALAKIAGLRLVRAYREQHGFSAISAMPTNLYGPNDNFDLESSHVLPALIRKFHEAKVSGAGAVTLWGTGSPRREFLHVDDLADACIHLMRHYDGADLVNVGWGEDVTIRELAEMVRDVVGFTGDLVFDTTKPDGTPRKLLDVSRLSALGFRPRIRLVDGIRQTYEFYRASVSGNG